MEQSHGTPTGCGRGRPMDITELRRPNTFPTYAEYVSAEGPTTNGMFAESQWLDQTRGHLILFLCFQISFLRIISEMRVLFYICNIKVNLRSYANTVCMASNVNK